MKNFLASGSLALELKNFFNFYHEKFAILMKTLHIFLDNILMLVNKFNLITVTILDNELLIFFTVENLLTGLLQLSNHIYSVLTSSSQHAHHILTFYNPI